MVFNAPPIQEKTTHTDGRFPRVWSDWFNYVSRLISGDDTFPVMNELIANLPSAVGRDGHIVYVSNESGGAVLAFSDGTDWRRVTDRAVIS